MASKLTGTYSLSGCPSTGSSTTYGIVWSDVTTDNGNGATRTVTDKSVITYIIVRAGTTVNNVVFKPMLEESNKVTEYEPPSKYKIPVVVSGEEPFSEENILSCGFTKVDENEYYVKTSNTPSGKILFRNELSYEGSLTVSFDVKYVLTGTAYGAYPRIVYTDGTNFSFGSLKEIGNKPTEYVNVVYTTPANKTVNYITWTYGTGATQTYIKDIGIYTQENILVANKTQITTNIYLKEPLRKIANSYTKESFSDYIDFEKKKLFRNIYREVITNVAGKSSSVNYYSTFLSIISKTPKMNTERNNTIGFAISNKFIQNLTNYSTLGNADNGGRIQSYITTSSLNRVAYSFNDVSINTTELAQEKIGDGFEVCYVLAETIEEDIELPNIPTFKGTTIIEVDTNILPSNMEVKYYGKG